MLLLFTIKISITNLKISGIFLILHSKILKCNDVTVLSISNLLLYVGKRELLPLALIIVEGMSPTI
jgi:hypothetical protein